MKVFKSSISIIMQNQFYLTRAKPNWHPFILVFGNFRFSILFSLDCGDLIWASCGYFFLLPVQYLCLARSFLFHISINWNGDGDDDDDDGYHLNNSNNQVTEWLFFLSFSSPRYISQRSCKTFSIKMHMNANGRYRISARAPSGFAACRECVHIYRRIACRWSDQTEESIFF